MHKCPNCGYCPHCGRSDRQYPWVYPRWPNPYGPYWSVSSPNISVGDNTKDSYTISC